MKLTVRDRLTLGNLFPQQSSLVEQLVVKDIADKIKIDQAEAVAIELKSEGQGVRWNEKLAKDLDIQFTMTELNLLKGQIEKTDREKKITLEMVDLCVRLREEKPSGK